MSALSRQSSRKREFVLGFCVGVVTTLVGWNAWMAWMIHRYDSMDAEFQQMIVDDRNGDH